MKTAEQRARLIELRDVIIPSIAEDQLNMRNRMFSGPCCVIGHAQRYRRQVLELGDKNYFGIAMDEWAHMFSATLPNDKADLMSRVTDVIEGDL